MTIQSSDIVLRHSAERSDNSSNGGRSAATTVASGVKNALFPDVSQAERTAGVTRYRKVFVRVANDDDIALVDARVFMAAATPGDSRVVILPGTFTDTQSSLTGSEQVYGAAQLAVDVLSGATTLTAATEAASLAMFANGSLVRVSDKATPGATSGNEEFVRLTATPTYAGDVASLTFTPALGSAYSQIDTVVSPVIEAGNLAGTVSSFTVTTAGDGGYDDTTNPILVDSIGSIYQTWTLTFTSATAFTVSGNSVGQVGTGNKSSTLQPTNTAFGKPYFTMVATGYSGTFAAGDTITFITTPPELPLWYKMIVPAGAAAISADTCSLGTQGESA